MRLSVIIPVYNVKPYIDKCLASIVPFCTEGIEIIAIDDGSTDGCGAILDKWSEKYPIKVVHQSNGGLSSARNKGMSIARGKYVSFVDSDDFVDGGELLQLLATAENGNYDIVVGDYFAFEDANRNCKCKQTIPAEKFSQYDGVDFFKLFYKPLRSMVWRSIYKSSFLKSNSFKFHEGVYFEDVEFTPLVYSRAKKVVYCPVPFYYYRQRRNSITTSFSNEKKLSDVVEVWDVLNKESYSQKSESLACIFRELGFHAFLNQYSVYRGTLDSSVLSSAHRLSRGKMYTNRYRLTSFLFRILPNNMFHKILTK